MQKTSPNSLSTYRKTVLDNGVRIVSEHIPSRTVSLGIWVDIGSRDEHDLNNGYAHFVEHMLFKGTQTRTSQQLAREFDVLGGTSNAFTTRETTCFHASVLDDKLPQLVELLSDIFLNSVFSKQELERERQVIFQEVGMVEDTPDELIHDLFASVLWKEHPLGNTILGSRAVIANTTDRSLMDFVAKQYSPEKILIAAAGNVIHEEVVALFEAKFSALQAGAKINRRKPPPILQPKQIAVCKPLEQEHVVIGTTCPSSVSDDRYVLLLLNILLGGNMSSRLFQEVREKRGLAYSVYSYIAANVDSGYLGVYLGIDPQSTHSVISLVAHEVEKICHTPFAETELADAKDYAKAALLIASDNMDTRMLRLARNEMLFGRYFSLDEVIGSLESVKNSDILALAQKVFSARPLTAVALGPLTDTEIDWQPFAHQDIS